MPAERTVPTVPIAEVRAWVEADDAATRERITASLTAVYSEIEDLLSPDEARELWQSIPPKRKRGYRKPRTEQERDFSLLLRDAANRYLPRPGQGGMTAEESAAKMADELREVAEELGEAAPEPEALRRKLDRLWKTVDPEFSRRLKGERRDTYSDE